MFFKYIKLLTLCKMSSIQLITLLLYYIILYYIILHYIVLYNNKFQLITSCTKAVLYILQLQGTLYNVSIWFIWLSSENVHMHKNYK